ncbi:hypothetical protein [Actinoallomurus sp. NPDC052274]|uniref:hypothetical protein n=1 Tax=Actinoallomurus sp. NPDC052274 TaxID=3155420 RepID=UPI0034461F77
MVASDAGGLLAERGRGLSIVDHLAVARLEDERSGELRAFHWRMLRLERSGCQG